MIVYFTIFPHYNYTLDGKSDACLFCCYTLVVFTKHTVFENYPVFYFFRVLSVWNFLIIKEENYSSLQDKVFSHWKKIFLDLQKLNITAYDPSHPLKFKNLIFCNK